MKINWKVRFSNPTYWINIALAIITPILAYFGIEAKDLNTWGAVYDTIIRTIANPYLLVLIAIGIYNATVDPTTSGISDSARALTYIKPAPNVKVETEEKAA